MWRCFFSSLLVSLAIGCASEPSSSSPDPAASSSSPAPPASSSAPANPDPPPTYTEIFNQFLAPGTPGHCATAHCHADPGHNVWLCGTSKDTCYRGMVDVGLIDPDNPASSLIADPTLSPLSWISPTAGNMPDDAPGPNEAGRKAILAWIAAGAKND